MGFVKSFVIRAGGSFVIAYEVTNYLHAQPHMLVGVLLVTLIAFNVGLTRFENRGKA